MTQQTSESRRRCGYKIYIANRSSRDKKKKNGRERGEEKYNATNQIAMDYSHEERLCDLTVIEGKARRHHIVETRTRAARRNAETNPAAKDSNDNDRSERGGSTTLFLDLRNATREVTLRKPRNPAYDATNSTRIACVVKKTQFTL